MYVPAWLQLKRVGAFVSKSLNADGIQMSSWKIAWFTCMGNVGAWRMLGECSTSCDEWAW
jgi:hypothetical protein